MVMIGSNPSGAADDLLAQFQQDVLSGLQAEPRRLPAKYLYDRRGSELFDQISRLPEYYLTRTELEIFKRHKSEMADFIGPGALVIEPGSGMGIKSRSLLSALEDPSGYVPIEIDQAALNASSAQLERSLPHLRLLPLWGDFGQVESLGELVAGQANPVVFFPGSTIGNYEPHEAVELLVRFAQWTGPHGKLILGLDLEKDPAIIKPAYNDAAGITAAFNLNVLARINRELKANFDLERFRHIAPYRPRLSRVEMHLISLDDQVVVLGDTELHFRAGETIHTENSYKYRLVDFCRLAAEAGWQLERVWTDEQAWCAVLGFGISRHRTPRARLGGGRLGRITGSTLGP